MSAAEDLELITEVLDRLFFKVIEVAEKRASLEAIRKLEMAGKVTIGADGRYEPKNQQVRQKLLRMITWRLCVRLDRWHSSNEEMNKQIGDQPLDRFNRARLKWIESDRIEGPWCALEAQTKPFETVKKLPVGEEP